MALTGMRGLSMFISDVRNCQNKEQEKLRVDKELANIRTKFKAERALTPYEKKKYVWKMLYIYMLGYDVDFGHMEAVSLISAQKYAEKQVGYVVTAALLNENHDFLRLVINTVRNDIIGRSETNQCLALTLVGNIGGREFSESLAPDVQKLLISSTLRPLVRKKAALCLLRLYRKNPDVVNVDGWSDRMAQLLDERDIGVLTAVMSLLLSLVASTPDGFFNCVPKCVRILERLTRSQDIPQEYTYYGIPSPWLQVKAMRVLQYFPSIEDPGLRRGLFDVLQRVLTGTDVVKNVNKNNAAHAALFEAIALVMHLEADKDMMSQCVTLLGKFIAVREPNIRYLGLENMTRMLQVTDVLDSIKRYQGQIIASLKDPDISIRRRALDLLYGMCDTSNARDIVEELLQYLTSSDFAIREELALKAAILAEKFAPDLSWYVDVILQLIEKAGDFVSDDIWYRVVQFVTNNEDLQAYAAAKVVSYLDKPAVHETMVKVGGYILGEYSHLLARQPGCSPKEIFNIIHDKFPTVSTPTKALLLSSYVKILMHTQPSDPELQDQVLAVFKRYESFVDAEVQQRAVEYFALSQRGPGVADILAEMPKFPERESALLKKAEDTEVDVAEVSALKQRQQMSNALVLAAPPPSGSNNGPPLTRGTRNLMERLPVPAPADANGRAPPAANPPSTSAAGAADLLGDLMAPLAIEAAPAAESTSPGAGAGPVDPFALALYEGGRAPAVQPSGSLMEWYKKLCVADSGVIYEDPYIQIGVKAEWRGPQGRILFFLGNKHTAPLSAVRGHINPVPGLRLQLSPVPDTIPPRAQLQCPLDVSSAQPPVDVPHLDFAYHAGPTPVVVKLKLPIVLSKFLAPSVIPPADFFARWKALEAPNKVQEVVRGVRPMAIQEMADYLSSLHIGILPGLDPNPNNLVAASLLFTEGNNGILNLVRIETDPADRTQLRLTVASPDPAVTLSVKRFITEQIVDQPVGPPAPLALPAAPANAQQFTGAAAALAGLM